LGGETLTLYGIHRFHHRGTYGVYIEWRGLSSVERLGFQNGAESCLVPFHHCKTKIAKLKTESLKHTTGFYNLFLSISAIYKELFLCEETFELNFSIRISLSAFSNMPKKMFPLDVPVNVAMIYHYKYTYLLTIH
jgi:hypothetical protein